MNHVSVSNNIFLSVLFRLYCLGNKVCLIIHMRQNAYSFILGIFYDIICFKR